MFFKGAACLLVLALFQGTMPPLKYTRTPLALRQGPWKDTRTGKQAGTPFSVILGKAGGRAARDDVKTPRTRIAFPLDHGFRPGIGLVSPLCRQVRPGLWGVRPTAPTFHTACRVVGSLRVPDSLSAGGPCRKRMSAILGRMTIVLDICRRGLLPWTRGKEQ